jgi:hypothetical protein
MALRIEDDDLCLELLYFLSLKKVTFLDDKNNLAIFSTFHHQGVKKVNYYRFICQSMTMDPESSITLSTPNGLT